MTCIIGFIDKSKRKMVIAGDRMGSNGHSGSPVNKPKVFQRGKVLFGYTTSFRFGQILEHHLTIPKDKRDSPYEFMVLDLVPKIRKVLEQHKYSSTDEKGISGTAILMYKGFVYTLQEDWSVLEYTDYQATGSGEDVASGALIALRDIPMSNKERANIALDAAAEVIVSVGGGTDVIVQKY